MTIGFEQGVPVSVNGMKMDPVSLVELLNEIGARNAIGRIDLVENRFVGIKSRGCYETPGGTLLIAAHRELEALCLEREVAHFKQHIGLKYAELVYFGLWFTPLREALDAFVEKHAEGNDRHRHACLSTREMFRWSAASRSTRCIAPTFHRSPWATATTRKMPQGSFAFWVCRRARVRGRALRLRDEDVVGTVPAAAGSGFRALAAVVRLRPPLAAAMNRGQQRARARLKNAGVLSADELISILQGCEQIGASAAASPAFLEDNEAEDVHHFVEKQLVALIGETGYKLHSGRSRNEQIATDLRLVRAGVDRSNCASR